MAIDTTTKPSTGTEDEASGKFHEVKGKVKEALGNFTNDPDLANEGTAEKSGGFVEKKVGQVKKVFGS